MDHNKTAREIAAEYEDMGIKAASLHYWLHRKSPYEEFNALALHVLFCTTMHRLWWDIALKLEEGPELYESDGETPNSEWGMM